MSHPRILKQSWLITGLLTVSLACLESLSFGDSCKPPTPSPCAADGVCRPNRGTWGYSHTRWRQWPGDPSLRPTPSDADTPIEEEQGLPDFETPPPEQEDLRGPAKDKAAASDEGEVAEAPANEPVQPLPAPEELPGFDPQGTIETLPQLDDAPPELPESLRQAAASMGIPQQHSVQTQLPPVMEEVATDISSAPAKPVAQPVQQASWKKPADIGLINPASAIVVQPESESLRQAIYYEASDQPQN